IGGPARDGRPGGRPRTRGSAPRSINRGSHSAKTRIDRTTFYVLRQLRVLLCPSVDTLIARIYISINSRISMSLGNQLIAAAATYSLALCGVSSNLAAQQVTKDGVRLENANNTLQRPYRQAGSSDPRDRGPHVARGFGKRDRRLIYVAVPGGSAGG